ncbi:MAG: glycine cleavage system aminomethyltransferase GcvT [Methylococcales bacterium]
MMIKQTPLYQLHLELGAKMVAFAGYQMPIYYPEGIIQEHLHCRSHTGIFDISHMGQCLISGDEAASELERLTPSDITGLKPGQQKYTVLTNQDGGILDDIMVTRLNSGLLLVVNAVCKDQDFHYLYHQLSERCHFVELSSQALISLQGPTAAATIRKLSTIAADLLFMQACETELCGIKCTISRSGYTGEDGFEISLLDRDVETLARILLAESEVKPIGLGARDTLRLEAGLCLYGHELNACVTPIEAGLQWLIKKGHGQFPGAPIILDQLRLGAGMTRAGLVVDSKAPVREGSVLLNSEGFEIGYVTSGSFSPSLGKPIAMALIKKQYAGLGTRLFAKVREHQVAVTVTRLPFIPHRYQR